MDIRKELQYRVLILDGAMGTMIQQYNLAECDYRGERFADWHTPLKGNYDLLVLTQPDIIRSIHAQYLEAGADIIKTNTFNAQAVSMKNWGMELLVPEINREAARLARQAADEYTMKNPAKPRFVAGVVGPAGAMASEDLIVPYKEQMVALIQGGVDMLLIETVISTTGAVVALQAAQEAMNETGKQVELMVSATVSDKDGCILSGETIQALLSSVLPVGLLSVGLNCSYGAEKLKPYLKEVAEYASCFVSAHPNAGLPDQLGQYHETPEIMAMYMKECLDEQLVNIIGGCCGTTPAHIAGYSRLVANAIPRKRHTEQ